MQNNISPTFLIPLDEMKFNPCGINVINKYPNGEFKSKFPIHYNNKTTLEEDMAFVKNHMHENIFRNKHHYFYRILENKDHEYTESERGFLIKEHRLDFEEKLKNEEKARSGLRYSGEAFFYILKGMCSPKVFEPLENWRYDPTKDLEKFNFPAREEDFKSLNPTYAAKNLTNLKQDIEFIIKFLPKSVTETRGHSIMNILNDKAPHLNKAARSLLIKEIRFIIEANLDREIMKRDVYTEKSREKPSSPVAATETENRHSPPLEVGNDSGRYGGKSEEEVEVDNLITYNQITTPKITDQPKRSKNLDALSHTVPTTGDSSLAVADRICTIIETSKISQPSKQTIRECLQKICDIARDQECKITSLKSRVSTLEESLENIFTKNFEKMMDRNARILNEITDALDKTASVNQRPDLSTLVEQNKQIDADLKRIRTDVDLIGERLTTNVAISSNSKRDHPNTDTTPEIRTLTLESGEIEGRVTQWRRIIRDCCKSNDIEPPNRIIVTRDKKKAYLKFKSQTALEKIAEALQDKNGEHFRLKIALPNMRKMKILIMGIPEDASEDDLCDSLVPITGGEHQIEIVKVTARGNFKNYILQMNHEEGNKLVHAGSVCVDYVYCRVVRYIRVVRCFRCQSFGHMAGSCVKEQICGKCSGNHETRNCESTTIKCINCDSHSHGANSPLCPVFKDWRSKFLKKLSKT